MNEMISTSQPSVARVYDYWLGGKDNFPADRELATELELAYPDAPRTAQANRQFLRRATAYMAGEGIDQFIDLGAGLPTEPNVHQVAQQLQPSCRVVYVDNDRMVLSHARALLQQTPSVAVCAADIRKPAKIINYCRQMGGIDFSRPVGVLMLAVLHFVSESANPARIIQAFTQAVPGGSYLAISHATWPSGPREKAQQAAALYDRSTAPVTVRDRGQIASLFEGWSLVARGIASAEHWPEQSGPPDQPQLPILAGLAAKTTSRE